MADTVVNLSHLENDDGKMGTGASLGRREKGWWTGSKGLFRHVNDEMFIKQYVVSAQ